MHQRVSLIGRLGANPDIRFTADNQAVANLRIATDETYKNKAGDKVQHTEWHRVVLFGNLANVAQDYLVKGRLVMVEGKLRTRKWTDKDNVDRYTTEIIGNGLRMLDSSKKESTPGDTAPPVDSIPEHNMPDDDVPF